MSFIVLLAVLLVSQSMLTKYFIDNLFHCVLLLLDSRLSTRNDLSDREITQMRHGVVFHCVVVLGLCVIQCTLSISIGSL